MSASNEQWNEPEAVLLLERTGKLVQAIETSGKPMAQSARELYHARLLAAHDAQDMGLLTELPSKSTWKVPAWHTAS